MAEFKYLIIGGGMTADAAVRGIRQIDPDGTIGLIGSEPYPPYNRPALSKKLWKGKPLDSIWRRTPGYPEGFHLGRTVLSIDPAAQTVRDDQGEGYGYDKLLLATGGTPRRLPIGPQDVIYFRSLDDYHHLRALSADKEHFGVIGGGFIGSEIAAALSMNEKKVTMFFPEVGIGAHQFPQELSVYLNEYYRGRVSSAPQVLVSDIRSTLRISHHPGDGREIRWRLLSPDRHPAERGACSKAGLNVTGNGIFADEFLHQQEYLYRR
jgi:NADPH-dependent 2,4-dienoyl-CoA reductase/sulfur reductase-like enzyme